MGKRDFLGFNQKLNLCIATHKRIEEYLGIFWNNVKKLGYPIFFQKMILLLFQKTLKLMLKINFDAEKRLAWF